MHHTRIKPEAERLEAVVADATKRASLCLDALNDELDGQNYLVENRFTAADIMMGYTLLLATTVELLDDRWSHVQVYYARLQAMPSYQKATQ